MSRQPGEVVATVHTSVRAASGRSPGVASAPSAHRIPAARPDGSGLPLRRRPGPLIGRPRRGLRRRALAWLRRTPGILALITVGLTGLGLAAGATGIGAVRERATLVGGVAAGTGPLVVAAQDLYRALSDADATVAESFLTAGAEPAGLRVRYQEDLAAASDALVRIAGGSGARGRDDPIRRISANLPVYTGIVETARALNRQGLPLGAAYLREASTLMRDALLPAAQELYRAVSVQLAAARDEASALPWAAVPLGLLSLGALVAAQVLLTRRTNRVFNPGLLGATAAALVAVVWLGLACVGAAGSLAASRADGSAQVDLFAAARVAALQARGDESLTLVARGAGADFERRFGATMARLAGDDGSGGLLGRARDRATDSTGRAAAESAIAAVERWRDLHTRIRELDDSGHYPEAVQLAVGTDSGSAGGVFTDLDRSLADGLRHGGDRFEREVADAADSIGGVAAGLGVLTTVVLCGVVVAMGQRMLEYR